MLVQHLFHSPEQPVGRGYEAPDTLDGLGDHGGHVAGRGDVEQVAEIVDAPGDELVVRQMAERGAELVAAVHVRHLEGAEGGARPGGVTGDGDGAVGLAVVAAPHGQDLVGAAVLGGQHQGGVVGLGTRVGEEHLGVGNSRQLRDLLGQGNVGLHEVQGGGVKHPVRLRLDRLDHPRNAVTRDRHQDPPEEVQVAVAFGVDYVPTLPVHQRDRLVVVQADPGGYHRPVAL